TVLGAHRPTYGLAFIQLRGPWDERGVLEQYRHTHWIGVGKIGDTEAVYDANAGYWVSREDWEAPGEGVLAWIAQHSNGATGEWFIRSAYNVHLPETG